MVRRPEMTHEPVRLALEHEKIRALFYGDFGRRKTTLLGTFPRPLIIDTNGGLVSIALQGNTPETFEPTGHEDLEALFWWIAERADDYDTIGIDTADNLCLQLMGEISDDAVEEKEKSGRRVSLRMRFVPEQGDYYANQQQMFRFLTALRRLNKHIVITSSLRMKNGRTAPNVSDGMEKVLCDWASIIGELILLDDVDPNDAPDNAGTQPYEGCGVLLTQESNGRATKSRFRSLKPYVVDPTFDKLADLIETEFAEAQAVSAPTTKRGRKQ